VLFFVRRSICQLLCFGLGSVLVLFLFGLGFPFLCFTSIYFCLIVARMILCLMVSVSWLDFFDVWIATSNGSTWFSMRYTISCVWYSPAIFNSSVLIRLNSSWLNLLIKP